MSDESLFSAQWYRVKDIRPQLASDVICVRHVYRDRVYYILHRRATSQYQKLDQAAYALIDKFDGKTTVEQAWERALAEDEHLAPTQGELINLLSELNNAELLVVDRRINSETVSERRRRSQRLERSQRYMNPLFLRVALHNPNPWLDGLKNLSMAIYSRTTAVILLLMLALATLTGLSHTEKMLLTLSDPDLLSGRNLLLLILVYLPVKALHELAHALAVKRYGGDVNEFGIALMVFFPIPYVDASASSLFIEKQRRMLVSAAGILSELWLASLGLMLWAYTSGTMADVGFSIFVVGGISTVLFNGNPLLKFDGYYVLADWLEIPNLYKNSRDSMLRAIRWLVTGKDDKGRTHADSLEHLWLLSFGLLSGIYRTLLMLSIAWMVSQKWHIVGILLALVTCYQFVAKPIFRALKTIFTDTAFKTRRAIFSLSLVPLMIAVGCSSVPLRHTSTSVGVIWLEEDAILRAGTPCEIISASVKPGELVGIERPLFDCENLDTTARVAELTGLVDELEVHRTAVMARDPLKLELVEAELTASRKALDVAQQQQLEQRRRSTTSGYFDTVGETSLTGRYFQRGDIIGYVVPERRVIHVAVTESLMSTIDGRLKNLLVRLPDDRGRYETYNTEILKRSPLASNTVSAPGLTTTGGGPHEIDPHGDGLQLLQRVYQLELAWPADAPLTRYVGSHVDVRINFRANTLLSRLLDASFRVLNTARAT